MAQATAIVALRESDALLQLMTDARGCAHTRTRTHARRSEVQQQ
jgi:hypothetical protein